jgi:hypothetical protein
MLHGKSYVLIWSNNWLATYILGDLFTKSSGANPTALIYNASVEKTYSATTRRVRF